MRSDELVSAPVAGILEMTKVVVAEDPWHEATTVYVPDAVGSVTVVTAVPSGCTGAVTTIGVPPPEGVMVNVTLPPTHAPNPVTRNVAVAPGL